MTKAPFIARDMDAEAHPFLLTCAMGVACADRDVVPAEHEWLLTQFGEEELKRAEAEELPLVPGAFLDVCAKLGGRLTDEQQDRIYPHLRLWLLSLAQVDSLFALTERVVVKQLLRRLGIPLRPAIQTDPQLSRISTWHRRRLWHAESSPSLLTHAMVVLVTVLGTLLLLSRSNEPEKPARYLYLEPPLEEVQKGVRAALSRRKYEDVLVLCDSPVTVPVELYRAAVERAGFPTNFMAPDLPWTIPDRELTYVCVATASGTGKRVCALLRLHPVPDDAAWFGNIDFGEGALSVIILARTTRVRLPDDAG